MHHEATAIAHHRKVKLGAHPMLHGPGVVGKFAESGLGQQDFPLPAAFLLLKR